MVRTPACRSRGGWFDSTSAVSKLGQFRSHPLCPCLSEETLKAVGPNSCVSSRLGCLEYNYLRLEAAIVLLWMYYFNSVLSRGKENTDSSSLYLPV